MVCLRLSICDKVNGPVINRFHVHKLEVQQKRHNPNDCEIVVTALNRPSSPIGATTTLQLADMLTDEDIVTNGRCRRMQ